MRSKLSCYAHKMHCCICKIVVQDWDFLGDGLVIIKQIDKNQEERIKTYHHRKSPIHKSQEPEKK